MALRGPSRCGAMTTTVAARGVFATGRARSVELTTLFREE